MKYVIGIDVGSGSARAGIFSLNGEEKGFSSTNIKIKKYEENFVEQSSEDIWNSVCKSVKRVLKIANVNKNDIIAIGFDATCSLVALDKNDNPVSLSKGKEDYWNIIMWMDHRAKKEADEINSKKHEVLKYVGGKISLEMEIPKILWLKRNLPNSYKRVSQFFDLADFLQYKACGNNIRSSCTLACKWTYLAHKNKWDRNFFKSLGLEDLIDKNKIGNIVKEPGTFAGYLTKKSSREMGLSINTKVAVGMIDAHSGGLGSLIDKVNDSAVIVAGTSACHMLNSKKPTFVQGVWGPYYNAMLPDMWLNEGGQSAFGSLIDYNIKKHPYYNKLIKDIKNNKNIYEILNKEVDKLKKENSIIVGVRDIDKLINDENICKCIKQDLNNRNSIDDLKPKLHIPILILHECIITKNQKNLSTEYKNDIINYHKERAGIYFKKQIAKLKDNINLYGKITFHLILFPVPCKKDIVDRFVNRVKFEKEEANDD